MLNLYRKSLKHITNELQLQNTYLDGLDGNTTL